MGFPHIFIMYYNMEEYLTHMGHTAPGMKELDLILKVQVQFLE